MAELIGSAVVKYLKVKQIVVGRDMRLSSDAIFSSLVKGILSQGCSVIDIGLSSTDMLYFAVGNYKYPAGIMITASHNPKEWNGFKIVRENAIPISEETGLKEIEKIVKFQRLSKSAKKGKKGRIIKKDVLDDFARTVLGFVDAKNFKPLKVVMDAANGMAGMIAPKIFANTKLQIIPMCFKLDGSFPSHESNPLIEENRRFLVEKVILSKADLGIAWDGDTDRCFFVDDTGYFVQGDFLTGILSEHILKKNPGSMVLYDLRASNYVPDTIRKNGGKAKMCRVGHAFFKQYMRDEKAVFGGEVTGHYYYPIKDFYSDNGWIPALQMIEIISQSGKKLSELLAPIKKAYFISGEINSKVENKDSVILRLEKKYKDAKKIYRLDGLSIEYSDWHFNVRPSNTEPLLRLNLEANTKQKMEQKRDEVLSLIRS